jgi:hypothetical protein
MEYDDWTYFIPNINKKYKINIFDDGNEIYDQYTNEWLIRGEWKGKVSLLNVNNRFININSISRWKLIEV